MTTPTDPTTLRTALERIVATPTRCDAGKRLKAIARAALATLAPAADDARTRPHEPECPGGYTGWECFCGAAPTPAPAADEAWCGFAVKDDTLPCGLPESQHNFWDHPFQPAPTPAPPTPPATVDNTTLLSVSVGALAVAISRDEMVKDALHEAGYAAGGTPCHPDCPCARAAVRLATALAQTTPPATGPVSVGTMNDDEGRAFIEAAKGPATDIIKVGPFTFDAESHEAFQNADFAAYAPPATEPDDIKWPAPVVTTHPAKWGRTIAPPPFDFTEDQPNVITPPATEPVAALVDEALQRGGHFLHWPQVLDVTRIALAAVRAEVDVERLRRAVHVAGSGRFGAGWDSHAVEDLVVAIAAAYREVEP